MRQLAARNKAVFATFEDGSYVELDHRTLLRLGKSADFRSSVGVAIELIDDAHRRRSLSVAHVGIALAFQHQVGGTDSRKGHRLVTWNGDGARGFCQFRLTHMFTPHSNTGQVAARQEWSRTGQEGSVPANGGKRLIGRFKIYCGLK
ncbi:hypothetical protein B0E45_12450 [Sinorhizobium sp. A49]|nr:hypothetical protein B0E45_12450 [Sinorhizobium sp. A49]